VSDQPLAWTIVLVVTVGPVAAAYAYHRWRERRFLRAVKRMTRSVRSMSESFGALNESMSKAADTFRQFGEALSKAFKDAQ